MANPERDRLSDPTWKTWGPYLAERAWGTVREDYSEDGDAWEFFPHDHARSRVYRWNEDGLAGLCDDQQGLCLAFAFWNGRDPILKERIFGLTGNQGNHGEDAKEHWWFLDSTPTHSFMRWRYHYPQAEFPYDDLVAENARRGKLDPEYELLDTGVFDERLLADRDRLGEGRAGRRLHLPAGPQRRPADGHPARAADALVPQHLGLGQRPPRAVAARRGRPARRRALPARPPRADRERRARAPVLRQRDQRAAPVGRRRPALPEGRDQRPRRARRGLGQPEPDRDEGCAPLPARGRARRDRPSCACGSRRAPAISADAYDETRARPRLAEADAFYDDLAPKGATADQRMVMRQAFAGMLWSKQFYHYDVEQLARRRPAPRSRRPRPASRAGTTTGGTSTTSTSSRCRTPGSTPGTPPGTWRFHCVALAHVDPTFAKEQLILLCREWYMHPNGQLPAYEWAFGDVNPPVHALGCAARLRDRRQAGLRLPRAHPAQADAELHLVGEPQGRRGQQRLRGRVPGPRQHRAVRPLGDPAGARNARAVRRHGLDGDLLPGAARDRAAAGRAGPDLRGRRHQVLRALRADRRGDEREAGAVGRGGRLLLRRPAARGRPSHAGAGALRGRADPAVRGHHPRLGDARAAARVRLAHALVPRAQAGLRRGRAREGAAGGNEGRLLSIVAEERLRRLLGRMLDESEFLSPHGLRSLSAYHREHPYELRARRRNVPDRLRAGRVDDRPLRRQLELARSGLVPDQLPDDRGAAALLPLPRRRVHRRAPHRLGQPGARWPTWPTSCHAGWCRCS